MALRGQFGAGVLTFAPARPASRERTGGGGIFSPMITRFLLLLAPVALSGCVVPPAAADPDRRSLEVLPAGVALAEVEADLLATARERFGQAALDRALAAPIHLMVKRFAGMAPPPPPGAGPDWRPPTPTALLYKERGTWMVATDTGWRQARIEAAEQLDAIFANRRFWAEPPIIFACPDFGAGLMLVKRPENARIVRNHQCTSETSRLVSEALRA